MKELTATNLRVCKNTRNRGFALVLTLSLISFVFLLVMGLITQVRLDVAHTDARESQILAKANARMGMKIAIGEIQKHLGPDMRVSATADIYDERVESSSIFKDLVYPQPPTSERFINLDEDLSASTDIVPMGQRMWTGVWKHRGSQNAQSDKGIPNRPLPKNQDNGDQITNWTPDGEYDHHPAIEVAWLVSGNEGWQKKLALMNSSGIVREFSEVPEGIDPDQRQLTFAAGGIYGKSENAWEDHKGVVEEINSTSMYNHPLLSLNEPQGNARDRTVWILKKPLLSDQYDTTNTSHQENWKDYLVGEPVKVKKTALHLDYILRDEDEDKDWGKRNGSYAFWVGDEGVKAKLNIVPPEDLDTYTKLKVSSEPNISEGSFGFELTAEENLRRKNIIGPSGVMGFLTEEGESEDFNHFYHAMTTHSFGVLCDVRTGGLKRDLSLVFSESFRVNNQSGNSISWKEDFDKNFIYRDRIDARKSIPLYDRHLPDSYDDTVKRNHWFDEEFGSEEGPSVLDDEALLAGPRWSVLADFHNFYRFSSNELEVFPTSEADKFPRLTGDNALIFKRQGIKGKLSISESRPFFNVFGGPIRQVRPEPLNHPIFPIVSKIRFSILPVVEQENLGLAINSSVSLWNPYDKPMRLEDIYLEIPFQNAKGGSGVDVGYTFDGQIFDLREYDLYRKWWMRLYNDISNDELPKYNFPPRDFQGGAMDSIKTKMKALDSPWGLFQTTRGKTKIKNSNREFSLSQPGLLGKPTFSTTLNDANPDLELSGLQKDKMYHEYPQKEDENGGIIFDSDNSYFRFHSPLFSESLKEYATLPRVFLYLDDAILEPGENAIFSIQDSQRSTIPVDRDKRFNSPPIIKLQKGDQQDFYIWETDKSFTQNSDEDNNELLKYVIKIGGIKGFSNKTRQQIEYNSGSEKFSYRELTPYKKYACVTLWHSEIANYLSFDPATATPIVRITQAMGESTYIDNGRYSYATGDMLRDNFATAMNALLNPDKKIPGVGWQWKANMPGSAWNENIMLNDFNLRALVHSSQHGTGQWFNGWSVYLPDHLDAGTRDNQRAIEFDGNVKFERNINSQDPTLNKIFTFDLEDYIENTGFPGSYGKNVKKTFPDVYTLPISPPWNRDDYLGNYNMFNNQKDPDIRATKYLGLQSNGVKPAKEVISTNPDTNPSFIKIPQAQAAEESIGFFSSLKDYDGLKSQLNEIDSSSRAVLFEVPKTRPLSLISYRYANLNNYLHGPNYALGNSYATPQVARHRPWGRQLGIESKIVRPDSKEVEENNLNVPSWGQLKYPSQFIELQNEWHNQFKKLYGSQWKKVVGQDVADIIDWGNELELTPQQGYGQWRRSNGQFEIQNTTIDHSFYLNRALLDGYFLSGAESSEDFMNEILTPVGQRFSPFLWSENEKLSVENSITGNHRLTAYLRKSYSWADNPTNYDDAENKAINNSYRYQSLAGDLLLDGAFNLNSTSVDAWIAQLSSLRGVQVKRKGSTNALNLTNETPIVRFIEEIDLSKNTWNDFRVLNDEEILDLAKAIVKQVKLRGPFLSFADFTNRRLIASPGGINYTDKKIENWPAETRDSSMGLKGALQSAIADAGLNDPHDPDGMNLVRNSVTTGILRRSSSNSSPTSPYSWGKSSSIPSIPSTRWDQTHKFWDSLFGYRTIFHRNRLPGEKRDQHKRRNNSPDENNDGIDDGSEGWKRVLGNGVEFRPFINLDNDPNKPQRVFDSTSFGTTDLFDSRVEFKSTSQGEAPENYLAIEHIASGACKPGWVMQSDILGPLAPVSSVRSDTFTVRVMGETSGKSPAKAWLELVVQRTPDYVKSDLDAPHHRPHEQFRDSNLNGYWDNGSMITEHWIDSNHNGDEVSYPDLPGVGEGGIEADYRDGIKSDKRLSLDLQEDVDESPMSWMGINQRFGRKFKIIRFRWLRPQDV